MTNLYFIFSTIFLEGQGDSKIIATRVTNYEVIPDLGISFI